MKKTTILSFILLLSLPAHAQVPGYLGKRLSMSANVSSFLFFDYLQADAMRLSYKTEVGLNYSLSRKVDFGFHFYTAKQSYLMKPWSFQSGYNSYSPSQEFLDCNLKIFEFHLRFFAKNFVAPVGIYHQLGIGWVNYSVADENVLRFQSYDSYSYSTETIIMKGPYPEYSGMKLSYHLGKITPIGRLFFINSAIGINYFQSGDIARYEMHSLTQSSYLLAVCNKNLRRQNFAEIKLGFGIFIL
ncbi:MAG TPA: hypothetical protein VI731_07650 [Bacteroidia bacterium]|nr:hypothetical protein [Bacteroidia bacterium]